MDHTRLCPLCYTPCSLRWVSSTCIPSPLSMVIWRGQRSWEIETTLSQPPRPNRISTAPSRACGAGAFAPHQAGFLCPRAQQCPSTPGQPDAPAGTPHREGAARGCPEPLQALQHRAPAQLDGDSFSTDIIQLPAAKAWLLCFISFLHEPSPLSRIFKEK